jgi:hypothetical protein
METKNSVVIAKVADNEESKRYRHPKNSFKKNTTL